MSTWRKIVNERGKTLILLSAASSQMKHIIWKLNIGIHSVETKNERSPLFSFRKNT